MWNRSGRGRSWCLCLRQQRQYDEAPQLLAASECRPQPCHAFHHQRVVIDSIYFSHLQIRTIAHETLGTSHSNPFSNHGFDSALPHPVDQSDLLILRERNNTTITITVQQCRRRHTTTQLLPVCHSIPCSLDCPLTRKQIYRQWWQHTRHLRPRLHHPRR